MGIPTIVPYAMPCEAELPENTATWQPDPQRAVLLVHDMQRYFVDFLPAGSELVSLLVNNAARLREVAIEQNIPIVYTAQPGAMTPEQRGLLRDIWGPGMTADARSRRIVDELAPRVQDTVLTKWRYSAFHRSRLEQILRESGRDQLIICGVYAHVGVLKTALDAFTLDIEPFLVADAIADFTEEDHRMTLDYAARRCAVTLSTRRAVEALSPVGSHR
ncbi:isochorismatase family protein [Longispora sp. K20-0274]|uniref:isochorismatase family protein n=1 Tax=Longispora sp. K20-0274 TaxID=3088255 RepID=UPI00399B2725